MYVLFSNFIEILDYTDLLDLIHTESVQDVGKSFHEENIEVTSLSTISELLG